MDAANVDLKAFSEDFYNKITLSNLQTVLDTLVYVKHETDVWLEITTLLIPGENDCDEEIDAMTKWIRAELGTDVPLHFSAFHPDFKMMDHPPTPPETLTRARNITMTNGLRYVYTGNVHDPDGSSTYCSQCKNLLIERDWYQLGQYNLKELNKCRDCDSECPGHFDEQPGTWGPKRQPVQLSLIK